MTNSTEGEVKTMNQAAKGRRSGAGPAVTDQSDVHAAAARGPASRGRR